VRVLALDTSTPVGAVAVVVDDAVVCELTIRVRESPRRSSGCALERPASTAT
jgi:hypothetical protein